LQASGFVNHPAHLQRLANAVPGGVFIIND
jgi:hypothetical protein